MVNLIAAATNVTVAAAAATAAASNRMTIVSFSVIRVSLRSDCQVVIEF
jgi:hypothetical protein